MTVALGGVTCKSCRVALSQQHAHLTTKVGAGDNQVKHAIAVDVRHHHGSGDPLLPASKSCAGWKVPLPLPSSTLNVPLLPLLGMSATNEVRAAIAIDVRYCDGVRPCASVEVLGRLEGAVAVNQQQAHRFAPGVGDNEVRPAIAIDVGHHHRDRQHIGVEVLSGLEGAVAVAQQHAHIIGANVSGDQVKAAVPIDVRYCHGLRKYAGLEAMRGLEKCHRRLPSTTLTVSLVLLEPTRSGGHHH